MSTSYPGADAILDQLPPARTRTRSRGPGGLIKVPEDTIQDLARTAQMGLTRVVAGNNTACLPDAPDSGASITAYACDIVGGDVLVGGTFGRIATADDQSIGDDESDIPGYDLDGTEITLLSADGKTYEVAIVAIDVDGEVELRAVAGAEANDGEEVGPTVAQIRDALIAAEIADHRDTVGLVIGRLKFKRVATDTITVTKIDPASNAASAAERCGAGALWGVAYGDS